jgi:drug/metabolite transporter (DMT)-like permease
VHGRDAAHPIDAGAKSVSVKAGRTLRPTRPPGGHQTVFEPASGERFMSTSSSQTSSPIASEGWFLNQPYLLLSIAALCWAGNAIVGRLAAGHVPPATLSMLRWALAFLIVLPFSWKHLLQDGAAIRSRLGTMLLISITGIGAFNYLQYWSLEYTSALNTLLLQSALPLLVAVWSLLLLGVRLTLAQAVGVVLSLTGVLVILLHGDLSTLTSIQFNKGDVIFMAALTVFAFYSVIMLKRPAIHPLSFATFTFGCGALGLFPLVIRELLTLPWMAFNAANLLSVAYVAVFPSTVAYLCYNRGVQLIGANRAAPFFHLVPLLGAVMAMVFLGEQPQPFHFIGFALVLTGVFVASRKSSAQPSRA